MSGNGCQACGGTAEFSLEPDDGSEVLACALDLVLLVNTLFSERLASGELKVYDLAGR